MQCVVANKPYMIVMLLSYDGFVTFLLTGLFLWPLWRGMGLGLELRQVATRTVMYVREKLTGLADDSF